MMKTFISPNLKTVCSGIAFIFMGATFPNTSNAQNASCGFGVDTTKWYAGAIQNVSWSPDGTKLLVTNGTSGLPSGSINSTYDHTVVNAADTNATLGLNTVLSKNVPYPSFTNSSIIRNSQIFTPNGGAIYMSNYVSPTGLMTALPSVAQGGTWGHSRSLGSRDTTVFFQSSGTGQTPGAYTIGWLNDHNPESPQYGTVPGLSNSMNINAGVATMGDRIYYQANAPVGTGMNGPTRIKCVTYGGTTCPNWTDIVVSTGQIADIQIRPTDSLIFARTEGIDVDQLVADQEAEAGGVIIFNKNGVLASGFNFTDLSLLAQAPKVNGLSRIRFDAAGNIFANISLTSYACGDFEPGNQVGIAKFDPKGNLDLSFYRNMLNSYSRIKWSASSYFDVNPVTGMIASALSFYQQGGQYSSFLGGDYVQGNNVPWYQAFPDNGTGSGSATPFLGYDPSFNNKYTSLHLYYNNGKLKVEGENAANASGNCGAVIPPPPAQPGAPAAHGTLDCGKLAFMQTPVMGAASTLVLKVNINVDTIGVFKPINVTGSGLSLQDPNASFNATHTGLNEFYLTLVYNGSTALGQFSISVGNAGSCTADLSDTTKSNPSIINIWTPENCTYKVIGPDLK